MVFAHFPPHLTEEEELLQKKYAKLRKRKRALALKTSKPEPQQPDVDLKSKKRSAEEVADAMEKAKKLLKSGAIKVEADKKESFKRTKRQKDQDKSTVGFTPFSPTHGGHHDFGSGTEYTDQEDNREPSKEIDKEQQSKPRVKKLYDSFVSSRISLPRGNSDDKLREERREREAPKRGNTIYVHGHGITDETLRRTFSNFGNIVNVNMEKDKNCGFITFDKMESSDEAISEMNGSMVGEIQLRVTMARRQPTFENLNTDVSSSSWSTIAANQSQKSSYTDKRDLVTYDDESIF